METTFSQPRLPSGLPWDGAGVLTAASPRPYHSTPAGILFEGDCLDVLPTLAAGMFDTIFADPPFNLGKEYGKLFNDSQPDRAYLDWCKQWIAECVRLLAPGGAVFLYNLPKWNIPIGAHLMELGLVFRHDIAVNIKLSLPIQGRLYPSHYSLLYFTKGPAKTFRRIRTPIERCRHCTKELKDYGGHRGAMNPKGVNLTDVWNDIPPVRHRKFKSEKRTQNQLSTKLVWRCIQMTTRPGDMVLDPFGGAGTTFDVCEHSGRRWVGTEIQNADVIVDRLEQLNVAHHATSDVVDE